MSKTQLTYHKVLQNGKAAELEYELQKISERYRFSPKINEILHTGTETILCMDRVEGDCLANIYGENPEDIPKYIWIDIRHILATLFDYEGIEYIDITPYNFMETPEGNIKIIDFGHAYYTTPKSVKPQNWFLREFLDGENTWNPDFK